MLLGTQCAINLAQISVNNLDGLWLRSGPPATGRAWTAFPASCAALRASNEKAGLIAAPFAMCRNIRAPIFVQGPDNLIFDKAMFKRRAGMVDHDGVDLTGCRPQDAPDHLTE